MNDVVGLVALADPTRRALFERLARGPRSVGELVEAVSVSQPAVSQHLKVLRQSGLVAVHRSGARRIYRARRSGLDRARRYIRSLMDQIAEQES